MLLVAVGCGVPAASDVVPSAFTLALCESALERRLAVENDQARVVAEFPISALAAAGLGAVGNRGFAPEWERLEEQHAEASRDISALCLVPAGIATPTTPIGE